ncbi:hypothetical protein ACFVUS_09365 [Nocardia sp. NPDC058058]|uniref:hypothetical protein n=1 Tax=Nocardia sp. NPDC058058 TaxID=3346317 RepID=UPI0036D99D0D
MERLRRKLESLKAAETPAPDAEDDASGVTRLPRRPRRMTEEPGARPDQIWRPDGGTIYDPAPTRPVLRSELQRETGWWPVDPGRMPQPAPQDDANAAGPDANIIDLDALRRKRAGDAPAAGIRRVARPRRIGQSTGEPTGVDREQPGRDGDPDTPPDPPVRRH